MNEIFYIFGISVSKDTYSSMLSLELSIVLGILGIAITIFTVIYSFLGSKQHQKKLVERSIHISKTEDPYLHAELKFMRQYINRNKKINCIIIKIIYVSIMLAVLLLTNIFFINKWLFMITEFCIALYALCFISLLIYYIHIYRDEVR